MLNLKASKNDIVNKDYYEKIKSNIECSICLCPTLFPFQCSICKHIFCEKCIFKWINENNSCPYRCQNFQIIRSYLDKSILSELIIKCKYCQKEIKYENYENYKNHYLNYECNDFMNNCVKLIKEKNEKNHELKLENINLNIIIDKLKRENNQLKKYNKREINKNKKIKEYIFQSKNHKKPLFLSYSKYDFNCNNCRKHYRKFELRYNCSFCDYNLCKRCKKKEEKEKKENNESDEIEENEEINESEDINEEESY